MGEQQLRLNDAALAWAAEDGEVVALDLKQVRYVGINRVGSRLWEQLATGTTRSALVALLETEYDIDAERAGVDVDAFVDACRERGYLA